MQLKGDEMYLWNIQVQSQTVVIFMLHLSFGVIP